MPRILGTGPATAALLTAAYGLGNLTASTAVMAFPSRATRTG
jgi:hypothetical protein